MRFSHPLVRSAIYASAAPARAPGGPRGAGRRRPPRPIPTAGRGTWRRRPARPTTRSRPSWSCSADRARARGGHAAQATFLRRSAELTTDPAVALRRTLDAADAYVLSGELATAGTLVGADRPAATGPQRARGLQIAAEIDIAQARPAHAAATLMHAVAEAAPGDTDFIRDCLCEALLSAILAGRYLSGTTHRAVAAATLSTAVRRPELGGSRPAVRRVRHPDRLRVRGRRPPDARAPSTP